MPLSRYIVSIFHAACRLASVPMLVNKMKPVDQSAQPQTA
ncbi:hypothetical protein FB99_01340 [Pantoea agglomerans]|nr:hypothetical protein FB99_01340 [Pantoea agglomerans]